MTNLHNHPQIQRTYFKYYCIKRIIELTHWELKNVSKMLFSNIYQYINVKNTME